MYRGNFAESFNIYSGEVNKFAAISIEEEKNLALQIQNGSEDEKQSALDKLVTANLRFVIKIAQDFIGRGIAFEDLIAEGNIGLLHAAKTFDPAKGAKFSSHSAYRIKLMMMRSLQKQAQLVRVPVQSKADKDLVFGTYRKLFGIFGREPSADEISEASGMKLRAVERVLAVKKTPLSIDAGFKDGQKGTFSDIIPDEKSDMPSDILSRSEDIFLLEKALSELTANDRFIIENYYLHGKTLNDIGREMHLTKERIRQLKSEALEKLRLLMYVV